MMVTRRSIWRTITSDVLVVDRHTLGAVNLLDLMNQVYLHLAGPARSTSCPGRPGLPSALAPRRVAIGERRSEPSSCLNTRSRCRLEILS